MKVLEYKQLFLSEAQEILNSLNSALVSLEKDPSNLALLHELFRQSHTLKSMAQSMRYKDITKLTHSMETALASLRSGRLKANRETVDLLFQSVDTLGRLIQEIGGGEARKEGVAPLVKKLEQIASAVPKDGRQSVKERRSKSRPHDIDRPHIEEEQTKGTGSSPSFGEVQTVRVPLTQLDTLMDITGELVISRSRLGQVAQTIKSDILEETVTQVSRLTSQLQNQMMQVRLVPLEYIFAPYPRMVRDMAVEQKKEVDLLIEGGHLGLDRSIQDEINEPLLHLLKNAVIHGIEEPEDRERLKKTRRGKIKLAAKRERNSVVLELSDDGRGMDVEEIKESALKTGIITKEELSAIASKEVVMLTTYPGYSRAKKVTEAAGRGVGLNASRIKVESLGGTLDIDTKPDEGTTLSIKLPLTMAIVEVMLVSIADATYCIPLSYIAETIKISPREIKTLGRHQMISYRDTVLPLISLREKFGFPPSTFLPPASDTSSRISTIPVVVVEMGPKRAGLVVDSIVGQQEAVIKPLTGILAEIKGASGATVLGTGKTALVADIGSLFQKREGV
ncbi:MAG: chemotaxis protein CheA [Candidatus Aerophobetes bacterium]